MRVCVDGVTAVEAMAIKDVDRTENPFAAGVPSATVLAALTDLLGGGEATIMLRCGGGVLWGEGDAIGSIRLYQEDGLQADIAVNDIPDVERLAPSDFKVIVFLRHWPEPTVDGLEAAVFQRARQAVA